MNEIKKLELAILKEFIFNDEVSQLISDINQNFLEFNILEITGMGTQEIKHSSLLAWILNNSEHNLEYEVFVEFLKKVYAENNLIDDELQNYIYLSKKQNLIIYREQENIDLLIEDHDNYKIFVIENKIFADERIEGDDGGQLEKYEKNIKEKYSEKYKIYYIFLTPNSTNATSDKWLRASYQMITDVITHILKTTELLTNTRLILESYVDLLKRKNIVKDKNIQELCKKIWDNKEYREALEIIFENKPSKIDLIEEFLKKYILIEKKINAGVHNYFIKLNNNSPYIYRLIYDSKGKGLGFVIVTNKNTQLSLLNFQDTEIGDTTIKIHPKLNSTPPMNQFNYVIVSTFANYCISEDTLSSDRLESLMNELNTFDNKIISNVPSEQKIQAISEI